MAFMNLYTEHGRWYVVEVNGETHIVGPDLVTLDGINVGQTLTDDDDAIPSDRWEEWASQLRDYVGPRCEVDTIRSVELRECWGARYSAPGYMDCTDWVLGSTEEEVVNECEEMYGDDDEQDHNEE